MSENEQGAGCAVGRSITRTDRYGYLDWQTPCPHRAVWPWIINHEGSRPAELGRVVQAWLCHCHNQAAGQLVRDGGELVT